MKYLNIIIFLLFFFCSLLIYHDSLSQERIQGKIILGATELGNQPEWYYEWVAYVNPRWWSDYYLTTSYYSGETPKFYRDEDEAFALNSPSDAGQYNIAWGQYEFTFHLKKDGNQITKVFYLDLRDANWSSTQPPYPSDPDTKIRWNHSLQKFQYKNKVYTNWTSFSAGSDKAIWDLFNISTPKQDVFQPTPPLYFKCTNPNETGAHPHFTWSPPIWPGSIEKEQELTIYYWVYRNGRYVAKELTSCSWTDPWVTIDPNGSNFSYFVKASLAHSPMSDPSNSVSIKGSLLKQHSGEPFQGADSTIEISTEFRSYLSSALI